MKLRELISAATPTSADMEFMQEHESFKYAQAEDELKEHLRNHAAALADLVEAAKEFLASSNKEAKLALSVAVAQNNYTDAEPDEDEYALTLIETSIAQTALTKALADLGEI